jgi:signal transduction histidine kinase
MRVAVLGAGPTEEDWPSRLTLGDVDVVRAQSLQELLESPLDLAVAIASGAEAVQIATAFASRDDAAPLTLLLRRQHQRHPQERVLEALVRGKREWEGTFDAMDDPLAILRPDGGVARANLALARSLNLPVSDTVSRSYLELLGAADPTLGDPIAESLHDGLARTREAQYAKLPQRRLVTTYQLQGAMGSTGQLLAVLRDQTEILDRQQRLQQATRLAAVGRLAGGVAHEINSPLASIALRTERLRRNARAPELQALPAFADFPRHLEAIEADVFRCKTIIGALLDFGRNRLPEATETDLNALVAKAVELVGYQMKAKNVQISLGPEPSLPRIRADDGQLQQAIVALLMNALDAVGAGGRVVVETSRDGERRVALSVTDNGAGISPEHMDKLFTPFFTTKPVGSGMGLGLAVCHGIVTAHGGEIGVTSELGRGTRVSMSLPIAGAPGAK